MGWLTFELAYSRQKWPDSRDDEVTAASGTHLANTPSPETWKFWLDQYLHRAGVLGLDTAGGRQALGKYVATAVRMLDSVERMYGPLPVPGVVSGELLPR